MLLISEFWNGDPIKRVFKAPLNTMFLIKAYSITSASTAADQFIGLTRAVEELDQILSNNEDYFLEVDLQINGLTHFVTDIDEKAKFITLGPKIGASITSGVQIYGEFIKASTSELIWEWFRKGR